MPLSENEQRLLEQMEKALAAEDPKFASALRGRPNLSGQRFAGAALVLLVLGVALIIAAVAIPLMPIGVIGFLAVLVSVLLLTSPKPSSARNNAGKQKPKKDDLMKRFEQRWDNRNQGDSN
jgi:Flp pilus assembly protein TadB